MATQAKTAPKAQPPAPKKAEAPPPKKENLPAVQHTGAGVPAHLAAKLAASAGRGVSTAREDNILPLVYVLQKGSPCVDERNEGYVKGAKPGEFWVRGTEKVISGKDGWLVQPCAFLKCWIEWGAKRGDGFKARHPERPDEAQEKMIKDDQGRDQMAWVMPNGNVVVETREHYVLDGADAYVIPMTSTQHTVSRGWMALMNQFRDDAGRPLDSFARVYRLTTVQREKDTNKWYVTKVVDAGWVETAEQYDRGAALYQAVMSGEKVAETPDDDVSGHETGDEDAERAGV
jgi:hypothetical protein